MKNITDFIKESQWKFVKTKDWTKLAQKIDPKAERQRSWDPGETGNYVVTDIDAWRKNPDIDLLIDTFGHIRKHSCIVYIMVGSEDINVIEFSKQLNGDDESKVNKLIQDMEKDQYIADVRYFPKGW